MRHFVEYQALGNRYLVAATPVTSDLPNLNAHQVRDLCDGPPRRDGVLEHAAVSVQDGSAIRAWIWNADGTLAENSGNGTRILAKYLADQTQAGNIIDIDTGYARVGCEVRDQEVVGRLGHVKLQEVMLLEVPGIRCLEVHLASVGNPHCVCFVQSPDAQLAQEWGPKIEVHKRFPQRTNVQFVQVVDRRHLQLEIWERGSGYTQSSGSSASAAVAVARHLGLVDDGVAVQMPGGELLVRVNHENMATICGPIETIGSVEVAV